MRPSRALSPLRLAVIPILITLFENTNSLPKTHLICKQPNTQTCLTWFINLDDIQNNIEEIKSKTNIPDYCGINHLQYIASHRKAHKLKLSPLDNATSAKTIFCKRVVIKGRVSDWREIAHSIGGTIRVRRQGFVPRGRYRGQTQSQYLAIDRGNGKDEGKAEAHSAADSSRASVSGNSGMGQAQSQSIFDSACDDCPGKSDHEVENLKRPSGSGQGGKSFAPGTETFWPTNIARGPTYRDPNSYQNAQLPGPGYNSAAGGNGYGPIANTGNKDFISTGSPTDYQPKGGVIGGGYTPSRTTGDANYRPNGVTGEGGYNPTGTAVDRRYGPAGATNGGGYSPAGTTNGGGYIPTGTAGGAGYRPTLTTDGGGYKPIGTAGGSSYNPIGTVGGDGYIPTGTAGGGRYGPTGTGVGGGYTPPGTVGSGDYGRPGSAGGGGYSPTGTSTRGSYSPTRDMGGGGYSPPGTAGGDNYYPTGTPGGGGLSPTGTVGSGGYSPSGSGGGGGYSPTGTAGSGGYSPSGSGGGGGYSPTVTAGSGGYSPSGSGGGGGYSPTGTTGSGGYSPSGSGGGGGYSPTGTAGSGGYSPSGSGGGGGYSPTGTAGSEGYSPSGSGGGGGYSPTGTAGSGGYSPSGSGGGGGYSPTGTKNGGGYSPTGVTGGGGYSPIGTASGGGYTPTSTSSGGGYGPTGTTGGGYGPLGTTDGGIYSPIDSKGPEGIIPSGSTGYGSYNPTGSTSPGGYNPIGKQDGGRYSPTATQGGEGYSPLGSGQLGAPGVNWPIASGPFQGPGGSSYFCCVIPNKNTGETIYPNTYIPGGATTPYGSGGVSNNVLPPPRPQDGSSGPFDIGTNQKQPKSFFGPGNGEDVPKSQMGNNLIGGPNNKYGQGTNVGNGPGGQYLGTNVPGFLYDTHNGGKPGGPDGQLKTNLSGKPYISQGPHGSGVVNGQKVPLDNFGSIPTSGSQSFGAEPGRHYDGGNNRLSPGGVYETGPTGGPISPGRQYGTGPDKYGTGPSGGPLTPGGQYESGPRRPMSPEGNYGTGPIGGAIIPGSQYVPGSVGESIKPGEYETGPGVGTMGPGGQYGQGHFGGTLEPGRQYGTVPAGGTMTPGQYGPGSVGGSITPGEQYGKNHLGGTQEPGRQYGTGPAGGTMAPGAQYGPGIVGGSITPGRQYGSGPTGGSITPEGQYGTGPYTANGLIGPNTPQGQYGKDAGGIPYDTRISKAPNELYEGSSMPRPNGLPTTGTSGIYNNLQTPNTYGRGTNGQEISRDPTNGATNISPDGIQGGQSPNGQFDNISGYYNQGVPKGQTSDHNGVPPLNYIDPNSIIADGDDSEAEASVGQTVNGTTASASSKGGNDKGRAQTNVHGTYTGTGSFQAQAQITGENKEAQSEVSGGKKGASSSASGSGRNNKSQANVQLGSETGSVQTQSQSNGVMHSSNSQVQGSVKGGMADAQARGPGSTSSQAQIGFTPYKDQDKASHDAQEIPFTGGGLASAQSSGRTGQSQSQLHGTFKYGITYNGAAQSGASLDKDTVFPNRLSFDKIDVFDENEKNINVDMTERSQSMDIDTPSSLSSIQDLNLTESKNTIQETTTENVTEETMKNSESRFSSHTHLDHHKSIPDLNHDASNGPTVVGNRRSFNTNYVNSADYELTTDKEENLPENYDTDGGFDNDNTDAADVEQNEYANYDDFTSDSPTHESYQSSNRKRLDVQQTTGGNTQHIVLGSLKNHNAEITQKNSERPDEGKVYQPGERVPGTGGYTIPIGFTGSVKSVASKDKTYVVGSKDSPSQAQTVTLTPGAGKIKYKYPASYAKYVKPKNLRSLQTPKENDNRYVSVSKSVTRSLDGENNIRKQYSHTYFTKSSSCGYFTFTCTMVSSAEGRKKVCKPKIPTNPDGTPIKC